MYYTVPTLFLWFRVKELVHESSDLGKDFLLISCQNLEQILYLPRSLSLCLWINWVWWSLGTQPMVSRYSWKPFASRSHCYFPADSPLLLSAPGNLSGCLLTAGLWRFTLESMLRCDECIRPRPARRNNRQNKEGSVASILLSAYSNKCHPAHSRNSPIEAGWNEWF